MTYNSVCNLLHCLHFSCSCACALQEVALIGMLAYLSYLCGELLGISGIVSLFCCGVVTSHYVRSCTVSCAQLEIQLTVSLPLSAVPSSPPTTCALTSSCPESPDTKRQCFVVHRRVSSAACLSACLSACRSLPPRRNCSHKHSTACLAPNVVHHHVCGSLLSSSRRCTM